MKTKVQPADFIVEEKIRLEPAPEGAFGLYRLTKEGQTTPGAVRILANTLGISMDRISYAGLKDRHARTIQTISIAGIGGPVEVKIPHVALEYLGRSAEAVTRTHLVGNRFTLVLRDLRKTSRPVVEAALESCRASGVPNYFDSQRMGSARHGQGFPGKAALRGKFEEALKLHLATPSEFDRGRGQAIRRHFARFWGSWEPCMGQAHTREEREVFGQLQREPRNFAAAFGKLHKSLRLLLVYAYQSFLWNRILGIWLEERLGTAALTWHRYLAGRLPFYRDLPKDLREQWRLQTLDLPSDRMPLEPGPVKTAVDRVLKEEGIRLADLGHAHPVVPRLRSDPRPILLFPESAEVCGWEDDELFPGFAKATVRFDLPKGAYATLVIKRILVELEAVEPAAEPAGRERSAPSGARRGPAGKGGREESRPPREPKERRGRSGSRQKREPRRKSGGGPKAGRSRA